VDAASNAVSFLNGARRLVWLTEPASMAVVLDRDV
jgi:hypothetical protein